MRVGSAISGRFDCHPVRCSLNQTTKFGLRPQPPGIIGRVSMAAMMLTFGPRAGPYEITAKIGGHLHGTAVGAVYTRVKVR